MFKSFFTFRNYFTFWFIALGTISIADLTLFVRADANGRRDFLNVVNTAGGVLIEHSTTFLLVIAGATALLGLAVGMSKYLSAKPDSSSYEMAMMKKAQTATRDELKRIQDTLQQVDGKVVQFDPAQYKTLLATLTDTTLKNVVGQVYSLVRERIESEFNTQHKFEATASPAKLTATSSGCWLAYVLRATTRAGISTGEAIVQSFAVAPTRYSYFTDRRLFSTRTR